MGAGQRASGPADRTQLCIRIAADRPNTLSSTAVFASKVTKTAPPLFDVDRKFWGKFLAESTSATCASTGISELHALFRTLLFYTADGTRRLNKSGTVIYGLLVGFFVHMARTMKSSSFCSGLARVMGRFKISSYVDAARTRFWWRASFG